MKMTKLKFKEGRLRGARAGDHKTKSKDNHRQDDTKYERFWNNPIRSKLKTF